MASTDRVGARRDHVVVQSVGWKLTFAGLRAFGAAICVLAATSGAGGPAGQAAFALLAAATALGAVRGLLAGADVGPDGVVVRNTFRTHRLSWEEIEEVAPPPRRRRSCVSLSLRSGNRIGLDGCWSHSQRHLERMASAIRAARPAATG